jgi:hypothetical protein
MEFCLALVELTLANETIFGEVGDRHLLIKDVSVHLCMLEL